jgi:hypothetical protein
MARRLKAKTGLHKWRSLVLTLAGVLIATVCTFTLYGWLKNKNDVLISAASRQNVSDFFHQFADNGLLPIVRPGSQKVGGVYNASNGRWIFETATCFPSLESPSISNSQLPNVELSGSVDASVALGLEKLVGTSVDSKSFRSAKITFSDVVLEEVPEQALRAAYSASECPILKPIIESVASGTAPTVASDPLLVISGVFRGKRTLTVVLDTETAANEALGFLSPLKSVKAKLKQDSSGKFSVVLENDKPLPVAATVAFIPTPIGASLGAGSTKSEMVWMPFNPAVNSFSTQSLRDILGKVNPNTTFAN